MAENKTQKTIVAIKSYNLETYNQVHYFVHYFVYLRHFGCHLQGTTFLLEYDHLI